MKKILVVGELTQETADINQYLSQYFATQMCGDNYQVVASMVDMYQPDLVLINVAGFTEERHGNIFADLRDVETLPVLSCGDSDTQKLFDSYYRLETRQFRHIAAPFVGEDIAFAVCKILGLDPADTLCADVESEKHHILVVDDNAVLLRNMKSMLSEKYRVSIATSASQCMKVLAKGGVELIILDYEMPIVDGRQTLEMIRADEEYKDLPVFFLTGITDKAHVDLVVGLKPRGYFVKPPVQSKLIQAIDSVLEK